MAKTSKSKGDTVKSLVPQSGKFKEKALRRTDGQDVQLFTTVLTPREDDGHVVAIDKKRMLTRDGLLNASRYANLRIVKDDPEFEWDEAGRKKKVLIRGAAIGINPMGNISITMSTIVLDYEEYKLKDLMSLINKKEWKNNRPVKGSEIQHEWSMDDEGLKEKGLYPFMVEVDPPLYVGVDMSDWRFAKFWTNQAQRRSFLERVADGILEARLISSHPAIGGRYLPQDGKLKVVGGSTLMSQEEARMVYEQAKGDPSELKNQGVDVQAEVVTTDDVQDAELEEAAEAEAVAETKPEPKEEKPAKTTNKGKQGLV